MEKVAVDSVLAANNQMARKNALAQLDISRLHCCVAYRLP